MKLYYPEWGPITYDGVRQYFLEDFHFIEQFRAFLSRYEACYRMTEDPALEKTLLVYRRKYYDEARKFTDKWNATPPVPDKPIFDEYQEDHESNPNRSRRARR